MSKTYEDGLAEGRIIALENTSARHGERLDSHSARLRMMERLIWLGGGIAFAIQSYELWGAILRKMIGVE